MAFYVYITLALIASCYAQLPAESPTSLRSSQCLKRNGYYKVDNSCDAYVECVDYVANNKLCPEGLHFDLNAIYPNYPCGYPADVPCQGRGAAQAAKPTADCPHQFGIFSSPVATPDNCGQYRICVGGHAFEMTCPTGLAFNAATSRCDWPDLVPSCKTEAFLGFSCPAPPVDLQGKIIDITINYKYEGNCYYFFACRQGKARLLSCDIGLAFDPLSGRCVEAEQANC